MLLLALLQLFEGLLALGAARGFLVLLRFLRVLFPFLGHFVHAAWWLSIVADHCSNHAIW